MGYTTQWISLSDRGETRSTTCYNADAFSRLPLSTVLQNVPTSPEFVHMMEFLDTNPVSVSQISIQTANNPTLSKVKPFVMNGWTAIKNLLPEFHRL